MEITYIVIVSFITFVTAEVMKAFNFNSKYLPMVNLGVGLLSAVVCLVFEVLPRAVPMDYLAAIITCVIASMGSGGFYDLLKTRIGGTELLDDVSITNHEAEEG